MKKKDFVALLDVTLVLVCWGLVKVSSVALE